MKKFLLIIMVLQCFALNIWADRYDIVFRGENEGDLEMENKVPVTGGVWNGSLNLTYGGSNSANVSVTDNNGSVVYSGQFNSAGSRTVNLNSGDYTVRVEESTGNAAVADVQIKK